MRVSNRFNPSAPTHRTRDATIEDVPALAELWNASIREDVSDFDKEQPVSFHTAKFVGLKGNPCLVHLHGDSIVAYATLHPKEEECYMFTAQLEIAVDTSYRRQGVGTGLWDALRNHPAIEEKEIYTILADVLSINLAGLAFLDSLKFHKQGVIEKLALKAGSFCNVHYMGFSVGYPPIAHGRGFPEVEEDCLSPTSSHISLDSSALKIRDATWADLDFLTEMYNDSIMNTNALEFFRPKSKEKRAAWMQHCVSAGYPILIAEEEGERLAYMSITPWSTHPDQCYRNAGYISAYVLPNLKRKKVGEKLFHALVQHPSIAKEKIALVLSGVCTANASGMQATLKAGFVPKVVQARIMVKPGQLLDVAWFTRDF